MSPVTVCLFAFLLVVAPVYGRNRQWDVEEKRADVKSEVGAAHVKLLRCMEARDLTCVGNMYTDDVVLMPQGQPTIVGKDAVLEYLQWIEHVDYVTFRSRMVEAAGEAGDEAFELYEIHVLGKNSHVYMEGKGLTIWKKGENGYQIYRNIFNSD